MTREKPYLALVREAGAEQTKSTRTASRERAIADLRALLAGEEAEVRARYDAGRIVRKLTRNRRHGTGALGALARAVGCSEATLHRCALLVETWSPRAFDELAERTSETGRPLGFSQLALLAGIPSRRERKLWCDRTLRSGWSVRELERRWLGRDHAAEPDPARPESGVLAFHRGLAACREALAALLADAEATMPEAIDDLECALFALRKSLATPGRACFC